MSEVPDQEFVAVMLELAPYLCVSKIREYQGVRGEVRVRALMVAADVSTGALNMGSVNPPLPGVYDSSEIPVAARVHWLWCEGDQWTVDYNRDFDKLSQAFNSRGDAVAFLQGRIREYWKQERARPESAD